LLLFPLQSFLNSFNGFNIPSHIPLLIRWPLGAIIFHNACMLQHFLPHLLSYFVWHQQKMPFCTWPIDPMIGKFENLRVLREIYGGGSLVLSSYLLQEKD
jgi:hypothetical protein